MIKRLIFFASFLFFVLSVFADAIHSTQSADTIRLDEVIVTGSMPKVNLRNVPMSVTVVHENQIQNRLETSLLPLLNEEVPGLFITQRGVMGYGVANGSAGSMNIRGIGGAPTAGVLILIDGHPQYMGLMGHPLADSYQSAMTERVEVVRGPASVLYGSNAMGGVINIITKNQKENGSQQSARIMYGSYNSLSVDASSKYRKNRFFTNIDLGYNKSDGHRENMKFWQINSYAKAGYDLNNHWTTFADINLSRTNSSNPGTVSVPLIDNDAEVMRGVTSVAVENRYDIASGLIKFFYNFGAHHINDGYKTGGQPLAYRFRSRDDMMGISINQSVVLFEGNKTTAGFDYQRFGGKAWNQFENGNSNLTLADIHLHTLAGFGNIQQSFVENKLTLNAGIRLDYHEMNESQWIPQFGVSYIPTSVTTLKAIVSKGFRNPTIREMYMFPPQNPDLKAESLMNYEISLMQLLLENRLKLGLNVFHITGKNIIQISMEGGRLLNVNSGKVENSGFEIDATVQANRKLSFSTNYSFLHMKYKIMGAPQHKLYFSVNYVKDKWSFSSGIQHVSGLYKDVRITDQSEQEHFLLWNIRANYKITEHLKLFLKGENLLNQKYEINAGFPMPGITGFGGIQVQL